MLFLAIPLVILSACRGGDQPTEVQTDILKREDSMQALARRVDSLRADSLRLTDSLQRMDSLRVADSLRRAQDSLPHAAVNPNAIDTRGTRPQDVVFFAKTLLGTPYKYASTDPKQGFDCSGFITYVFTRFKIIVPRSSKEFTDKGTAITNSQARPGDLILFTGTDSTEKFVGHMGLIIFNDRDGLQFIHSTSGKANGVTITPFNEYYQSRYVKTIRIFPESAFK